jgi:hypothetical protein
VIYIYICICDIYIYIHIYVERERETNQIIPMVNQPFPARCPTFPREVGLLGGCGAHVPNPPIIEENVRIDAYIETGGERAGHQALSGIHWIYQIYR